MPGLSRMESSIPSTARSPLTFGMLSTFPPTACGIATFAAALSAGLIAGGHSVDVVRIAPVADLDDPLVLGSLTGGPGPWGSGVEVLDRTDVAIVQHEYGIYPGTDGREVLTVMEHLRVPTVVVAQRCCGSRRSASARCSPTSAPRHMPWW